MTSVPGALAGICALAALLGLAAHLHRGSRPPVLAVTAMAPYLMTGSVVALALELGTRQWPGATAAAVLLALCASTQWRRYVRSAVPPGGPDLVVMTANLRFGEADAQALVTAVREHRVEVLMLQELTDDAVQRAGAAGLDRLLPHRVAEPRPGGVGTGLWSRHPLTDLRRLPEFAYAAVAARIQVPGLAARPTVVALHLAGPLPDSTLWRRDVAQLPQTLRALPADAPVVVGGDFNATPDTVQFRAAMVAGFANAADQAGAGLRRSYPAGRWFPPLLAIDHVLTRDAVGTAARTLAIGGTDHRALLATVRFTGP